MSIVYFSFVDWVLSFVLGLYVSLHIVRFESAACWICSIVSSHQYGYAQNLFHPCPTARPLNARAPPSDQLAEKLAQSCVLRLPHQKGTSANLYDMQKDRIGDREQSAISATYLHNHPIGLIWRQSLDIFALRAAEPLVEEPAVGEQPHLCVCRAVSPADRECDWLSNRIATDPRRTTPVAGLQRDARAGAEVQVARPQRLEHGRLRQSLAVNHIEPRLGGVICGVVGVRAGCRDHTQPLIEPVVPERERRLVVGVALPRPVPYLEMPGTARHHLAEAPGAAGTVWIADRLRVGDDKDLVVGVRLSGDARHV